MVSAHWKDENKTKQTREGKLDTTALERVKGEHDDEGLEDKADDGHGQAKLVGTAGIRVCVQCLHDRGLNTFAKKSDVRTIVVMSRVIERNRRMRNCAAD